MNGKRFPSELVRSPIFLLKRLGMTAKEQTVDAYEDAGHSPYHHAILAVLDEGLPETQGAIADALGYDRGQLVGILDELEESGLVERRRDPDDRRRQVVLMTPAGNKALARMRTLSQRAVADLPAPAPAGGGEWPPPPPPAPGGRPRAALRTYGSAGSRE